MIFFLCRQESFVLGAYARNMVGLRTNTPFGFGNHLRASLYNGCPTGAAEQLAAYMAAFAAGFAGEAGGEAAVG